MWVGDLIFQSNAWLHDFQFHRRTPSTSSTSRWSVCWKPSSMGWLKINMDGAFSHSEQLGGIGIIIRDEGGNCVGGK